MLLHYKNVLVSNKMHKFLLKILLLTCSLFFKPTLCTAAETFLFSFEKDGRESFLLGTCHSIEFCHLPDPLKKHVQQRSVFVTENTDVQKKVDKDSISAMGLLKADGETIDYIAKLEGEGREELLKYVLPFLASRCSDEVKAEALNLRGLRECYIQGHFLNGMDSSLLKYFSEKGQPIFGLESLVDVSRSMDIVDWEIFELGIKHKEGFESQNHRSSSSDYLTGVIPPDEDCDDELLKKRNHSWLPRALKYNADYGEKALIAVGYCHLFGKSGLINLLQESGFRIKRMNTSGVFCDFRLPDSVVTDPGIL